MDLREREYIFLLFWQLFGIKTCKRRLWCFFKTLHYHGCNWQGRPQCSRVNTKFHREIIVDICMCVISTKKQQELHWIKWLILTGHTFQSAKIARNMKKKNEKIAEKVVECSLAVKTIYFNFLPLELFPLTVKNLLFPVNFDREKPFFLCVSILNFAREMLKKSLRK